MAGNQGQIGFLNKVVAAIQAGNVILNKNGEFIYFPNPGTGNLIYSNAPSAGTDKFGNPYYAGETIFGTGGVIVSYNGITGWYAPTAALGNLKESACAFAGGIDQFGNHVPIGLATYLVSGATPTYATEVGNGFIFVGPTLLGAPGIVGASAPPTAAQVTVSSGHLAASTPVSALFADSLLNTVAQIVIAAAANPVGVTQALLEVQGSANINNGKAGNVFAVGTGPSDFAGTVYVEDATAPATPGTASAIYSHTGWLHYVSEDANDYSLGTLHIVAAGLNQTINSLTLTTVTGCTAPVKAGAYKVRARIWCTNGAVAANQGQGVSGPATSAVSLECDIDDTTIGAAALPLGRFQVTATSQKAGTTNGGTIPANHTFVFTMDGFIRFTAAGTFALQVGCVTAAADTFVVSAVDLELSPIP